MSPEKKYNLRFGCWWKSTKFYKLWKPVYAQALVEKSRKAQPEYGAWQ